MYKQRYHIKLLLLLCAGILLPTMQAAQQPINRDAKIDIPSDEVYRLPTNLQPSVSKIKKATAKDQDLYLVPQQLMLVGGGIEEKLTWKRRSYPPNTYAVRIVCTGRVSNLAQNMQPQSSSFLESTFGALDEFGKFVKENKKRIISSAAFIVVLLGCLETLVVTQLRENNQQKNLSLIIGGCIMRFCTEIAD
ncbi:MAG: hypothetical protein AAF900_00680 [Bacteroidota bacterium]